MSLFNRNQVKNQPSSGQFRERKDQESFAMGLLLESLLTSELPDAIDIVILGPENSDAADAGAGFARFAARIFSDIGASHIRSIAAAHNISLIRLTNTGTFWMRFPYGELSSEERAPVLAAEAAVNRLLFVKEAFDAQNEVASWSEADCALADASNIATIAATASEQVKGAAANPLLDLFGTQGRKGGEWDIRTRFALAAEAMRLPYRLAYDFDCNAARGLFSVDYTGPLAAWMPQRRFDAATHSWIDATQEAPQQAARYALSVGVLLAAAAFGASVGISRVRIAVHPATLEAQAASALYVDRIPFISRVLPRIVGADTAWMTELLAVAATEDAQFDAQLRQIHREPSTDDRPLPDDLRGMLFADTVAELDVLSDMEIDSWDTVHAAEADREESPLAAIAVLESVVDTAEKAIADLPEHTKALYCSDVVSRFLLPLNKVDEGTRFVRYSDAGFRARSILCDLYCDMGEPDRAIQQAEKCIELAPTSTIGYTDLVNALFAKQEHASAIPHLVQALSYATHDPAISFIYYRLAYALWQAGRKEAALAAYVMCLRHNFGRPEAVDAEVRELVEEMGEVHIPEVGEAREILLREGITPAPTPQLRNLVASELVPLVDNGILDIAAPLTRMMGSIEGHRDELFAVGESLAL